MNEKEIMELYNLNDNDIEFLSSMKIERIPSGVDRKEYGEVVCIPLDMLVGYDRICDAQNWWEAICSLHKMNTLKWIAEKKDFREYMQNTNKLNADGFPCVSEYRGKYYISDDGCHRLTVAKCIGINNVCVYVKCQCSDTMI